MWWFASVALAGPRAIVAVGDGLVVEEPPAELVAAAVSDAVVSDAPVPTVAGGWVAVLADCLEERRPGQYALVDRTAQQPTAADARAHVGEVREMAPALVIVGVGIPGDTDRGVFRVDLAGLVTDLRAAEGPDVLLVGPIPAMLPDGREQGAIDRKARAWNDDVARIAAGTQGASHLDLLAAWPEGEERAGLTVHGRELSDQGHARVGAQVCDAVLAWEARPR